ncbi:MAG: toprim domain-containing protein [Anaerolineae bacterium]|nr:toprim domain-containing protein [Anaerolineae bacterium]
MMSIDLEQIRSANPIEQIVGEKFTLKRQGSRLVGVEHDSLVVTPQTGLYFWNSRSEHGDVFDFAGRHLLGYDNRWNNRDATMFWEVVRLLAQHAGIDIDAGNDFHKSSAWAERQLVQRLHEALLNTPAALDYVTKTRGWQLPTVRNARLGFMPQDKRKLLADLNPPDKWRGVIAKFPAGMIVYVHLEKGRLVYLSGRSIEGKQHYNPPRELVGERRSYTNPLYTPEADQVVLVEGQADAISFGEWGFPALAIAGMYVSDDLLTALQKHRRVFVALDNTREAMEKNREIARSLGTNALIPHLPDGVKDANDWLVQGAAVEDVQAALNKAKTWLQTEIERTAFLDGLDKKDAIRALFTYAVDLDEMELSEFRAALAKQGVKGRAFSDLLRAAKKKVDKDDDGDMPQILGDDIPLLSPALGFQRDVAIVTVSVVERTKDKKLNTQPYLVTSSRELVRLSEEQIIRLDGREVALRVMPEGSEFLMRWRFADIQRFLRGETVEPAQVFNTVRDLFTSYVDFRSPVESAILTLWTIGTYFYTMFPAYPYLALNGPKNSGKSTVMRVMQPLAFNMVTTSDPTGPSMFRLIHYTSCTVGIDEAERYHNPKDPGMQQIRQLLNSGYKQGMPAIRLIGEDMKPQAFDVYSPKILAAIMGMEDILASRCIAIPMRRTDKKMPSFPPDFDGAAIRHLLYTLALTHFHTVQVNYSDRPALHTLHNRSGELWSPLVALAAFFEEQGGVQGLLEAIATAAETDEQISEGKALSEREEAVLQALELMTRGQDGTIWIKAAALRERVARLIGQPVEKMGDAQWIGHILKRLHLLDEAGRKRGMDGIAYAVRSFDVIDMMRRYDVATVNETR